jgi:hypothetical protein
LGKDICDIPAEGELIDFTAWLTGDEIALATLWEKDGAEETAFCTDWTTGAAADLTVLATLLTTGVAAFVTAFAAVTVGDGFDFTKLTTLLIALDNQPI